MSDELRQLIFHSSLITFFRVEGRALFPSAVEVEDGGEPETAEEICAECVAGPVCAEIDARGADGEDKERGDGERKAAGECALRQKGVGDEEEEAEVADVEVDVTGREAFGVERTIDVDEQRRRARAGDDEFG